MRRNALILSITLLSPCALSPLASAQSAPQPGPTFESARDLGEWRARHGAEWQILLAESSGHAEMVFGGSAEPETRPETDGEFFEVARRRLAELENLHGIQLDSLVEERSLYLPLGRSGATTDKQTVRFRQAVNGVPVENGYANLLFDVEGRMLSFQTTALRGSMDLSTDPALPAEDAAVVAADAFEDETGLPANEVRPASLVIIGVERGERVIPRLAYKLWVGRFDPDSTPVGRELWIDAIDARVLRVDQGVHHFDVSGTISTNASPGLLPDIGSNPAVPEVMPYVNISSSGGSTTADANGNFTISGPNSVNNVNVSFVGTYANINNSAGGDYTLNAGTLSGSGNGVLLNPSPNEQITAQANAYNRITEFRDWVRSVNPLDSTMDFQATGNVNISQTCNATFSGNATNYYNAGGGCSNTAYSTVVAHEMGHWANSRYGTGNPSTGMGEGNADVWAMYQYDTPVVGANFSGSGFIRTGTNTSPFCGDCSEGCYGQTHANGRPWMGAAWKIRVRLKDSLGATAGGDHADGIFLGWMNAYDQSSITTAIEMQWLTLDDDDGNLANGTPNFAAIDGGFRDQGFPGFSLFSFTSLTELPDTEDQVGPYVVDTTFNAPGGGTSTATLFYSVEGAPYASVPMTDVGGGVFRGEIPGQSSIQGVNYYVSAQSGSFMDVFPEGGAANPNQFVVARKTLTFSEDFEASSFVWTVTDDASLESGTWELVDPLGTFDGSTPVAPDDDDTPGGSLCYVTQQGTGGGTGEADVDGGPTFLRGPAMNLGQRDAIIEFSYWFYNNDGDDQLVIEAALSGQASAFFTEIARIGAGGDAGSCSGGGSTGGEWRKFKFRVSDYFNPGGATRMRFSVADSPNNSVTEAAIDDITLHKLFELDPVPCGDMVRYCNALPNSTGLPAVISTTGSASVSANDLSLVVTQAPDNTGIFITSPDAVEMPLGNGNVCVGSSTLGFVRRLFPSYVASGGTASSMLDNTDTTVPALMVTAGSTWNYQAWFRDTVGSGFNFSDAMAITYCP